MTTVNFPDLVAQYPFFAHSPQAKSLRVEDRDFLIESSTACGRIEQDVFAAALFLMQQGQDEFSAKEIAEVLRLRTSRQVAAAFLNLDSAKYFLKTEDRVYQPFSLLEVAVIGDANRNRKYQVKLASALVDQLTHGSGETSYVQIEMGEYLATPSGLPKRIWLYCQNKRRNPKFCGEIEISQQKLFSLLPIQDRKQYCAKRTLESSLQALSYYLQYEETSGIYRISFKERANNFASELVQVQTVVPKAATRTASIKIIEDIAPITATHPPTISLEPEFSEIRAEVSTLRTELEGAKTLIKSLQSDLANTQLSVGKLNTEIFTLREIIASIEKKQQAEIEKKQHVQAVAAQPRAIAQSNNVQPTPAQKPAQLETAKKVAAETALKGSGSTVVPTDATKRFMPFASAKLVREYNALTEKERESLKDSLLWVQDEFAGRFDAQKLNDFDATHLCDYLPKLRDRWNSKERYDQPENVGGWVYSAIKNRFDVITTKAKKPSGTKGEDACLVNAPSRQEVEDREKEFSEQQRKRELGVEFTKAWGEQKHALDKNKLSEMLSDALAQNKNAIPTCKDGLIACSFVKQLQTLLNLSGASIDVAECKRIWQEARQICREAETRTELSDLAKIVQIRANVVNQLPALIEKIGRDRIDQLWEACEDNAKKFGIEVCHLIGLNGESEHVVDDDFAEDLAYRLVFARTGC